MYLFVDSTRDSLDKNIELIISLSSLPRWYDAIVHEPVVINEKSNRAATTSVEKLQIDLNLSKSIGYFWKKDLFKIRNDWYLILVSQKDVTPQTGTSLVEIHSWKSLVVGQPILRIHTTATKASPLTLPPE